MPLAFATSGPYSFAQRSPASSGYGRSISWPSTVTTCGNGHWKHAQDRLQALVSRFDCPVLLHSEAFNDSVSPLRVAERQGLRCVVSKRGDAPYRSGACRG
jgi:hypothetical protein